ncbi:MAG: pesticin C-terminus-like muramidase [Alphaproteobacteria bacterium]|nr:pesticin C-terminus-like muramidase [Alphaproteobacteria bacterium]
MISIFEPYLGLRGTQARAKLDELPLEITYSQAEQVDRYVQRHFEWTVGRRYDNAVEAKGRDLWFRDLDTPPATVIMSVMYQYGENSTDEYPVFWGHVTGGRWQEAANELMNFRDAYPSRRRAEGGYLQEWIDGHVR